MPIIVSDERGRITLGKDVIDKYGKEFYVVRAPKEVVLIPVAKDPVKDLQELGKHAGIDRYTIRELKEIARKEAEKESAKNLQRPQKLKRRAKRRK